MSKHNEFIMVVAKKEGAADTINGISKPDVGCVENVLVVKNATKQDRDAYRKETLALEDFNSLVEVARKSIDNSLLKNVDWYNILLIKNEKGKEKIIKSSVIYNAILKVKAVA